MPKRTCLERAAALLLGLAILLAVQPLLAAQKHIVDGTGTRVALHQDARRIVSLMPNVTEMLCFLGLEDRMVGRSSFCNYPQSVSTLPEIGGIVDTSIEEIAALRPDLVVAYQGNDLRLVEKLRSLGISVFALKEATSLADIAAQMQLLWRVAGAQDAAAPAGLDLWQQRLAALEAQPPPARRARVYFGYPDEVSYSCAPGSFISDIIETAGGRNVVPRSRQRWPQLSAEFILEAQPEVLLITSPCTGPAPEPEDCRQALDTLRADPLWSGLPAVRDGRVILLSADVLLRPGPRSLDALAAVRAALDADAQR